MEFAPAVLTPDFSQTQHLSPQKDPYVIQFIQLIQEVFSPLDQVIRLSDLDALFKQCRPHWSHPEDLESLFHHAFEPQIIQTAQLLEKHRKGNQKFLSQMNTLKQKEKRKQLLLSYLTSFSKIEIFHFPKKIKTLPPFFDLDAVQEIFLTFRLEYSIRLELLIALSSACLKKASSENQQIFQKLLLEEFQKRQRLQTQQVCLEAMLRLQQYSIHSHAWKVFLPLYCAHSEGKSPWILALTFELWAHLDAPSAFSEIQRHIFEEQGFEHFFLRQALIKLLEKMQQTEILSQKIQASDSSEFVQFQLIETLSRTCPESMVQIFSTSKYSEKTKAYALTHLGVLSSELAYDILQQQLSCLEIMNPLSRIVLEETETWLQNFYPNHSCSISLLQQVRTLTQVSNIPLQNKAIEIYERIAQKSISGYSWFQTELCPKIPRFLSKQKGTLLKQECPLTREDLGRLLTAVCARSFPLQIRETRRKWIFYLGDRKRFAFWRFLYELKHPSPEKRRTTSHLTGEHRFGTLRVPSQILSELSRTKVPGEHTYQEEIEGWAPHLPTIEDCLSLFRFTLRGKKVSLFTFRGITWLEGPRKKRIRLFLKMSWNYPKLDQLRRNACKSQEELKKFQETLLQQYQIRFWETPYLENIEPVPQKKEATIHMFFFLFLFNWHGESFFSLYPDFLHKTHLGIFLGVFTLFFLGKSFFRTQQFRRARKKIPLVIGGWGTRGKSGTERLKAAMLHEMGYRVFSKTTGCDAMFLHNGPLPQLQELYLFRPYEKASIWEQRDCAIMAEKLNVDVFLWECMALNPLYAQFLQEEWMQDDFSTLTNAYPDHEDIQGPSGIHVAQSLAHFIPKNATLITTEEQMLPILEQKAQSKRSQSISVSWREAYFIPQEVLQRLPYQEHPLNIALATRLGALLGISKERAWKGFGDFLVPDLGSLKTFGPILYRGRQLTFINGMSANERLGSIGNWKRCHLDQHHPLKQRDTWIVTVVNNRADRIARSKVFAKMLIEDISASRHFIIGTNLSGFKNYIDQAFEEVYAEWKVPFSTKEEFHAWLCHYKNPYFEESEVWAFLKQMLSAYPQEEILEILNNIPPDLFSLKSIDATHAHFDPNTKSKQIKELSIQLQPLQNALQEYIPKESLQEIFDFLIEAIQLHGTFHHFWKQWEQNPDLKIARKFFYQLLVYSHRYLENPIASGDTFIEFLTQQTPPGFQITIMGLQNIKQKTSMEFVHSWISAETLAKKFRDLEKKSDEDIQLFLLQLQSYPKWNLFTCEIALQQMSQTQKKLPQHFQESWEEMRFKIQKIQQECKTHSAHQEKQEIFHLFETLVEKLLDMTDAKRRRRFCGKLNQEFIKRRISHQKLSLFFQQLMQRQKGGWFAESFKHEDD